MQDIKTLPEFDVIRLLERARERLRSSCTGSREDKAAVAVALTAVDAMLAAKHQSSSTANARDLAEHLRFAARGLASHRDEKVQQAMLSMLAASDVG